MNALFTKSAAECVYAFAKAGLIHCKRDCYFCLAPMKVVETPNNNFPLQMVWKCTQCFEKKAIMPDTPLNFMNVKAFHLSLVLFIDCARYNIAKKLAKNLLRFSQ